MTKKLMIGRMTFTLFVCMLCTLAFISCEKKPGGGVIIESGPSLMVMSFNVRSMNMTEQKEQDVWENRRDACCAMINHYRPVMMGVQECCKGQRDYIQNRCRGYEVVGRTKDKDVNGEQTAIFYLKDSVTVQESGTFWLTETPGQVSRLEGHYHFRTATWVKALHKSTNVVFYHINTHLDNCGNDFRSVELSYVLDFIKKNCEDYPVVMTADWNEHDEHSLFDDMYKTFKNARFTATSTDKGATFNNFGANTDYLRIDHVFYKGFASCSKFAVERRAWNGHAYISDHYPIYATLHF